MILCGRAQFLGQIGGFALSDTVFTGACAIHGNRDIVQPSHVFFGPRNITRIVGINQKQDMKIAIPHMAQHRRDKTHLHRFRLCGIDTIGQPRYGHTHIG